MRRLLGTPSNIGGVEVHPYMFTGVHVLDWRAREALPDAGCIVRHAYRHWVDSGQTVAAVIEERPWHDLGDLGLYHRTNVGLANGSIVWPGVQPQSGRGLIAPDATFGTGATAVESVVGSGARLAPGARVERCVIWPGPSVSCELRDAIVTPERVVHIEPAPA